MNESKYRRISDAQSNMMGSPPVPELCLSYDRSHKEVGWGVSHDTYHLSDSKTKVLRCPDSTPRSGYVYLNDGEDRDFKERIQVLKGYASIDLTRSFVTFWKSSLNADIIDCTFNDGEQEYFHKLVWGRRNPFRIRKLSEITNKLEELTCELTLDGYLHGQDSNGFVEKDLATRTRQGLTKLSEIYCDIMIPPMEEFIRRYDGRLDVDPKMDYDEMHEKISEIIS